MTTVATTVANVVDCRQADNPHCLKLKTYNSKLIMTLYPKLILDALATVRYPGTGKNLVEAGMVEDNIRIDGMKVSFSLIFEKPTDPFMKSIIKAA